MCLDAFGGQKRASESLELELELVVREFNSGSLHKSYFLASSVCITECIAVTFQFVSTGDIYISINTYIYLYIY